MTPEREPPLKCRITFDVTDDVGLLENEAWRYFDALRAATSDLSMVASNFDIQPITTTLTEDTPE